MCVYNKLAEEKFIILWDIGTNLSIGDYNKIAETNRVSMNL